MSKKKVGDVVVAPFKYADGVTPENYECHDCGARDVKLWREYQTFLCNQTLRCMECACKDQTTPEKSRIFPINWKNGDQIGWLIPAVPTEEGDTYWGYTSVPQDGVDWWKNLKDHA